MDDSVDRRIGRLARQYFGLVTRAQLTDLGLGRGAIDHRIKVGRLIKVHSGIYAVGHPRAEPAAVIAAAVLAGGSGAAASHSSAAFLWGLRQRWEAPPEITIPVNRRPAGLRIHISKTLTRREIRHQLGIRVTSPARTLLDVAPRLPELELARAVNHARHELYMRLDELDELLERQPTHPGTRLLLPFVRSRTGPTRSKFEDRFITVARRYGLPEHRVNVPVAGWLVDALFPAERLIVEFDGYEFHGDRASFESDRERDAATLEAGYATVRVTWERLTGATDREIARLLRILRARRAA